MRAPTALTEFQETWLTLHRILHFFFFFSFWRLAFWAEGLSEDLQLRTRIRTVHELLVLPKVRFVSSRAGLDWPAVSCVD